MIVDTTQSSLSVNHVRASKVNYAEIMKFEPDWLNLRCNEVLDVLGKCTLAEKLGIIGEVADCLQQDQYIEGCKRESNG